MSINAFAVDLVGEDTLIIKDGIIEEVYGLYNTNNNCMITPCLISSQARRLNERS